MNKQDKFSEISVCSNIVSQRRDMFEKQTIIKFNRSLEVNRGGRAANLVKFYQSLSEKKEDVKFFSKRSVECIYKLKDIKCTEDIRKLEDIKCKSKDMNFKLKDIKCTEDINSKEEKTKFNDFNSKAEKINKSEDINCTEEKTKFNVLNRVNFCNIFKEINKNVQKISSKFQTKGVSFKEEVEVFYVPWYDRKSEY